MSSDVPFEDARTLITNANLLAASLIQWPNEPFSEPVGDPPPIWLSVDCIGNTLDPIEMGGGGWQEDGTVYVFVNAPANTGTQAARQMAKAVANVFRNLGPRLVNYRGAGIGQGAKPDDTAGLWYSIPVSIDYVYQDTTNGT